MHWIFQPDFIPWLSLLPWCRGEQGYLRLIWLGAASKRIYCVMSKTELSEFYSEISSEIGDRIEELGDSKDMQ